MDIFIAVAVTAGVVGPLALAAGGYLHYRFGARVKSAGEAVVAAVKQSQ
jgi:hypothetical protein